MNLKKFLIFLLCLVFTAGFSSSCCSSNISAIKVAAKKVERIYENDKNQVFFDTNLTKGNLLTKDNQYVYFFMESSLRNEWAIIAQSPKYVGNGSIEQINFLYFVPESLKIPSNIIGDTPLGFESLNGNEYLLLHNDMKIDLDKLKSQIMKNLKKINGGDAL